MSKLLKAAKQIENIRFREFVIKAVEKAEVSGDFDDLHYADNLREFPVDIKTFIEHPDYLNCRGKIYPKLIKELIEINNGKYTEVVFTGAIGTGKTTLALYSTVYQLYLLSCMIKPHDTFGLDDASEILIIFQNINTTLAKAVDYERFKSMILSSPYFNRRFMYDKTILSELRFPNKVIVKAVSGSETAAIGQNVIGGILDELNYMAVIENSKQSIDGGDYDQAIALYNSIARRRKSRFMRSNKLPGLLCLVSSKRYPGQFTDIKEAERLKDIDTTGKSDIYLYDKRTWEVLPRRRFSGPRFTLYIGTTNNKPYIVDKDNPAPPNSEELLMKIPVEYRKEFTTDIMNALREIAGVTTLTTHPYMMNVDLVSNCFRKTNKSVISRDTTDFDTMNLSIYPKLFKDIEQPRWCHIDLALTGDSAGVAIGYVSRFKQIQRGDTECEVLPEINIDLTLEVKPPKGAEIQFHKIRTLLYKLRENGLNIKWVTFDSYQSTDSQQILRTKKFITGLVSMDTSMIPYDMTKTALYDGRLHIPIHPKLKTELLSLERNTKKGKIDHPSNSSKDISDALAGVVYGLTTRKEIWVRHNVSLSQVPASVKENVNKPGKDNMKSG